MEGVGARLGRSSTRYGPTTVFSGPVRKWKKKWVPLSNPNNSNSNSNNNNRSHLLLYKWTPVTSQSNGSTAGTPPASGKDANTAAATPSAAEEPTRRKYRYVPVSFIEEQKQEASVKSDDESKPSGADASQHSQVDVSDGKADGNDVSMEEPQASEKENTSADEVKETNLDLSLGLKSHDGIHENKAEVGRGGQPERTSSGAGTEKKPSAHPESDTRKRGFSG
ncbi:hypothetical protein AXF42_Ash017232 [Apostasia shenzhenica]|uniref:Uncharacterized protein n=1 Tax=Apostasia shenzhenica TaxID=1088818 RepID=A0A2H9ZVH4_9ASPA|nr:hypothetical protein AXF42_Ash017232 [Apostasia shenzhenica]